MRLRLTYLLRGTYDYMGSDGGAVPWGAMLIMLGMAGLGAAIGFALSKAFSLDTELAVFGGLVTGLGLTTLWLMLSAAVAIVARVFNWADFEPRHRPASSDDERKPRRAR